MSKVALDLKQFKHVKSTDTSTTLRHKDGHELTVVHKSLSPEYQKQLEALSNTSGEMPVDKEVKKASKDAPVKMAAGGETSQPYEFFKEETPSAKALQDSLDPNKVDTSKPPANQYAKTYDKTLSELEQNNPGLNDSTSKQMLRTEALDATKHAKTVDEIAASDVASAEQQKAATLAAENQKRATLGMQPLPNELQASLNPASMSADVPPQGGDMQGAAVTPQQPGSGMDGLDPSAGIMHGYQTQLAGIKAEAAAQAKLGQQQQQHYEDAQVDAEIAQEAHDEEINELNEENKRMTLDIQKGHIDPSAYWKDHSKVASAIGMILGGLGGAKSAELTQNFLKHQMDQNLQAQAKNLDSKHNLLAANLRKYGNVRDAYMASRIQQNDMLLHTLQADAAGAQGPLAAARAQQLTGQIQKESAQMTQQFAVRRTMMNLANNPNQRPGAIDHMLGYLRVLAPEQAKEMEGRYIPGVGLSSVPLTPEVRGKVVSHAKLDNAIKDLQQWTKTHTTLVPGTPEYNTGAQKAMVLQQEIREGLLGTVFRESEKPLLEKMVKDNPANMFKAFNTLPQLKELQRSNESQLNTLKSTYGLPVSAAPIDQKVLARQWATQQLKHNPQDARALKILSAER